MRVGILKQFRQSMHFRRLAKADFRSGLGNASWLLYGLVRSAQPEVCVEIGAARGKSACYMGTALKENGQGRLYSIDPHCQTAWSEGAAADSYTAFCRHVARLGLAEQVVCVRAYAEAAAREWTLPIDLLFIDGDHTYEGVKRDWTLFAPHMRPFGYVVFHDTAWDLAPDPRWARADMGVPRFVDELRQQGYPVVSTLANFGCSIVQATRGGVPLVRTS